MYIIVRIAGLKLLENWQSVRNVYKDVRQAEAKGRGDCNGKERELHRAWLGAVLWRLEQHVVVGRWSAFGAGGRRQRSFRFCIPSCKYVQYEVVR